MYGRKPTEAALSSKEGQSCLCSYGEERCCAIRASHQRADSYCKLAIYLERRFSRYGYFVDCEYNKMTVNGVQEPKRIRPRQKALPDIIIHKRTANIEGNLAVIDGKPKHTSKKSLSNQRCKVRYYLRYEHLKYKHGFLVKFGVTKSL
jgi:hypothetical protein